MRKLFVHIGTHKTGTKSFQAWLLENRARLRSEGVAVAAETSRKYGTVANCFALANAVLRPGLMTQARLTGDATPARVRHLAIALARMRGFLATRGADCFVLSAEALCFARTRGELMRLRLLLNLANVEVVPVVAFREEAAWRASWEHQIEKFSPHYRHPHGTGVNNIQGDWYFERQEIMAFWNQIGRIRCIDYDSAVEKDGSIIPALSRAMHLPSDAGSSRLFLNARASPTLTT